MVVLLFLTVVLVLPDTFSWASAVSLPCLPISVEKERFIRLCEKERPSDADLALNGSADSIVPAVISTPSAAWKLSGSAISGASFSSTLRKNSSITGVVQCTVTNPEASASATESTL